MRYYFKIHPLVKEKKKFKGFSILALVAILFNGAELISVILVKGYSRNRPVKLF